MKKLLLALALAFGLSTATVGVVEAVPSNCSATYNRTGRDSVTWTCRSGTGYITVYIKCVGGFYSDPRTYKAGPFVKSSSNVLLVVTVRCPFETRPTMISTSLVKSDL